jgi:hypothetical protein
MRLSVERPWSSKGGQLHSSDAMTLIDFDVVVYVLQFQMLFCTMSLKVNSWIVVVLMAGSVLLTEAVRKLAPPRIFDRSK